LIIWRSDKSNNTKDESSSIGLEEISKLNNSSIADSSSITDKEKQSNYRKKVRAKN